MDFLLPRVRGVRISEIDLVRGMALGGMLLVNLTAFAGTSGIPFSRLSKLDWLSNFLILFLAEGKFYPLFAFLFGWGIARRQCNSQNKGTFFVSNFRRMLVLAGFGLAHAILIWPGDILFVYAFLGSLLPLMRRISLHFLLFLATFSLILGSILSLPGIGRTLNEAYADFIAPVGTPLRLSLTQSQQDLSPFLQRMGEFALKLAFFPDWLGSFCAMIVCGYLVGSGRVYLEIQLRLLLFPALILNLLFALINAFPNLAPAEWAGFIRSITLTLGGPLLAFSYALLLIRWQKARPGSAIRRLFMNAGRMPLTLYLLQSIIGIGLLALPIPHIPILIFPLAGFIFFTQLFFASYWFAHFQQGPFEAAWRFLSAR
jgi:uncharacterized protein